MEIALPVRAAVEGDFTYTVSNGEATVTDVNAAVSGNVVIPAQLGGCPATVIGAKAFADCADMTAVTIPASVRRMEQEAFRGCVALTAVV